MPIVRTKTVIISTLNNEEFAAIDIYVHCTTSALKTNFRHEHLLHVFRDNTTI